MATRSLIAIAGDTAVAYAYVHYDGYLAGVGRKLIELYNTQEDALNIAQAGYLSTLEKTIEESIEKSVHKDENPGIVSTERDLIEDADNCGAEYVYLWRDGQWLYSERYSNTTAEAHVDRTFKKLDDTRLLEEVCKYYERALELTLLQKAA